MRHETVNANEDGQAGRLSRRQFIKGGVAGGSALLLAGALVGPGRQPIETSFEEVAFSGHEPAQGAVAMRLAASQDAVLPPLLLTNARA